MPSQDYTPLSKPESPGFFAYPSDVHQFHQDRALYDKQEEARIAQGMNPLRDMSLGQISQLSELSPMELAHPSQMEARPGYQSEVPQSRYVPTLNETPQVRNVPGMSATGMGQMEMGPGPQVQPYKTVDAGQPSTLSQQMVAQQAMERLGRWPTGMSGVRNFNNKSAQRSQAMDTLRTDPNNPLALSIMQMTGGTENERDSIVDTRDARTKRFGDVTDQGQQRIDETGRHNLMLEQGQAEARRFAREYHQQQKFARDKGDRMAQERLDFAYEKHHDILDRFDAANKNGTLTPEMADDLRKGLTSTSGFMTRDPSEDEISLFERLGIKLGIHDKPRSRLETAPRNPPSARRAAGASPEAGAPPTADGAFTGAPSGKAVGDTLKEDGNAVARWDGKAWQRMK